jgi:predicted TIM-barrel fold metal-dependent hydrolase
MEVLTEDLYRNVPAEARPELMSLATPALVEVFGQLDVNPQSQGLGAADVPGRLEWCDQVGIDFQFVNGGGFTGFELQIPDLAERRRAIRSANDVLLDDLDSVTDRFASVSICDASDLEFAIPELQRCRGRGSRAFHLRAEPPGGLSYAHPGFDRLWSAAIDLGMVPYLHIGNTPANIAAGWANMPIDNTTTGAAGLMRLAQMTRHQSAETMLAAMTLGGVFGRFPKLTVLVAELWAGWLPFLAMRLDQNTDANRKAQSDMMLGAWPYDVSAGDFLRRNVRVSPLPGLGPDGLPTLRQEPGMVVFSSDYPHLEGSPKPIDIYQPDLDDLEADVRESFLYGNILEVFERMGDPLPVRNSHFQAAS